MALFKPKQERHEDLEKYPHFSSLPDATGPLTKVMPSSSIRAANNEVKKVLGVQKQNKRGSYEHFSTQEKVNMP